MWGIDEEEVKKRVYLASVSNEEVNCSSGPLTELAVKHILCVAPRKKGQLKKGYVSRLTCDAAISPCALILGLFYIRRLTETNPAFVKTTPSKQLFLAAMIAANKYLADPGEEEALVNSDWAELSKFSREKIDLLELQFLGAIDWRLFVSVSEFMEFIVGVEGRIALEQARARGWLSYSDLVSIWEWVDVDSTMISAASQAACAIATSTAVYIMFVTALYATSCSFSAAQSTPLSAGNHHRHHDHHQDHHHDYRGVASLATGDFSPIDFTVFHSSRLQSQSASSLAQETLRERAEWNWDWGPGTEPTVDVKNDHTCPWLETDFGNKDLNLQQNFKLKLLMEDVLYKHVCPWLKVEKVNMRENWLFEHMYNSGFEDSYHRASPKEPAISDCINNCTQNENSTTTSLPSVSLSKPSGTTATQAKFSWDGNFTKEHSRVKEGKVEITGRSDNHNLAQLYTRPFRKPEPRSVFCSLQTCHRPAVAVH